MTIYRHLCVEGTIVASLCGRVIDEDTCIDAELPDSAIGGLFVSSLSSEVSGQGYAMQLLADTMKEFSCVALVAFAKSGDHARLIAGYKRLGFKQLNAYTKQGLIYEAPFHAP